MHKARVAVTGLVVGLLVALVAGMVGGLAIAGEWTDPDTIVRVEGDAAHGFTIHRHDGTRLHPPTDSEALAECGEYDRKRTRIRCRARVRTWYRDLAELQRSLEWALGG